MEQIAIIGTGLIGRAWAMVFARAGHSVRIWDPVAGVSDAALGLIGQSLQDLAERHLDIPKGWSLVGAENIFIKRNGLCAGGDVRVIAVQSERQLELAPPFCTVKERS